MRFTLVRRGLRASGAKALRDKAHEQRVRRGGRTGARWLGAELHAGRGKESLFRVLGDTWPSGRW
ncbi:hypothetical protein [Streptomyces sp. C10]|uniref:hypothetical protein n=1 Tax=Streptomyces sp. C10 TaxID=531941 RepID=UPI0039813F24